VLDQLVGRRFSAEPDRGNPPLWTLESGSGRIGRSGARNEAAVTDYNLLDDSDGGHEPELAEQAFSEIETLAPRPRQGLGRPGTHLRAVLRLPSAQDACYVDLLCG
jgi:hypothetical protein